MTTFLRISFILFSITGDDYKGVLVCIPVYVANHDSRFLKGLDVLVESRIVICVITSLHFAQIYQLLITLY